MSEPTPMGVKGCSSCGFYHSTGFSARCALSGRSLQYAAGVIPIGCPLRDGPLVIHLAPGARLEQPLLPPQHLTDEELLRRHRAANWTPPSDGSRCFWRSVETSERCATCGKLVRNHYGGTEYRCEPRPEK